MKAVKKMLVSMELHLDASIDMMMAMMIYTWIAIMIMIGMTGIVIMPMVWMTQWMNLTRIGKAYVDRRHFSKIRKDVNYTPNKKTVLAFAIALELSIDEAKDLLNSAGFAFSRSSKIDIIVAYFLQNKIYDMFEINEILDAYGQPIFE